MTRSGQPGASTPAHDRRPPAAVSVGSAVTCTALGIATVRRRRGAAAPPMPRSISAPTIAACWSRARPAMGSGSSTRSPASSGWARASRPPAASATPAIERAIEALGDLPRQDDEPRRHPRAADRHRSLPRGGERRRLPRPRRARRSGSSSRSSTARPRRELAATGCTPLIDPDAEGVILFDIGGGSSELVRLGRSAPCRRGPPLPEIEAWASLPVGVVTLAERHGGHNVTREIYEAMVQEVAGHRRAVRRRATSCRLSTACTCSAPPAR